jgi:hypothetical protein
MLSSTPSTSENETPLVGVVVKHREPQLLVSIDPGNDSGHGWIQIGWIAQDD